MPSFPSHKNKNLQMKASSSISTLLFFSINALGVVVASPLRQQHFAFRRSLQTFEGINTPGGSLSSRPCNALIATVTVDEVRAFGNLMLQATLELAGLDDDADLQQSLADEFLLTPSLVKYGLAVHKVCGSCNDADVSNYYNMDGDAAITNRDLEPWCGSAVHGSNATHSALIFVPIIASNNDAKSNDTAIVGGKIPSFVQMHSFTTGPDDGVSQTWPDSIGAAVQAASADAATRQTFLLALFDHFASAIMASSGVVSILPDYIGYGASTDFRRSTMVESYAQAAVVSYAATGAYLQAASNGCSVLAKTGTMVGLSEGGFAVVPAAEALQALGVELPHVVSAAGPLNTFAQLVAVVDAYDNGRVGSFTQNNILFQIVVPYIGFVHSSDLPGLANTGDAEQRFLSAEFQNASDPAKFVPDTFFGPNAALDFLTAFARSPPNALDTLNPNLVAVLRDAGLLQQNVTSGEFLGTCPTDLIETGVNDLLCATMDQGSVWDRIVQTKLPLLELSFSMNDTVASPTNFPPTLFEDNPSVRLFAPPLPQLAITGDHAQACVMGSFASLLERLAKPLPIIPLSLDQQATCSSDRTGQTGDNNDTPSAPNTGDNNDSWSTPTWSKAGRTGTTTTLGLFISFMLLLPVLA